MNSFAWHWLGCISPMIVICLIPQAAPYLPLVAVVLIAYANVIGFFEGRMRANEFEK